MFANSFMMSFNCFNHRASPAVILYPAASKISSWDMVKVLVGHYPMTDPYLQLWTMIVQKVILDYSAFAVRVSFDRTCMEIGNIS